MEVALQPGNRDSPPGSDLDRWGELAPTAESVKGVDVQTDAARSFRHRDQIGSGQRLKFSARDDCHYADPPLQEDSPSTGE